VDAIKVLVYSRSKEALLFYTGLLHNFTDAKIFPVTNNMRQNILNLFHCDVIQIISADLKGFYGFIWCILLVFFKLINKPVFFYWIGSDVTIANKTMLSFSSHFVKEHMANAPWLADELQKKGIQAKFIPKPVVETHDDPPPLPKKFTILAYLGQSDRDVFYGGNIINSMIQNLPYNFIVLGGTKKLQSTDKVRYFSKVDYKDMKDIYSRSTVLVRITEHDGFSNMVQEALNYGRHVIWSMKYPYCHYATTYDDVAKILGELYKNQNLNILGMKYYRQRFDREHCARQFIEFYWCALNE
jgi:hypothetical protein